MYCIFKFLQAKLYIDKNTETTDGTFGCNINVNILKDVRSAQQFYPIEHHIHRLTDFIFI